MEIHMSTAGLARDGPTDHNALKGMCMHVHEKGLLVCRRNMFPDFQRKDPCIWAKVHGIRKIEDRASPVAHDGRMGISIVSISQNVLLPEKANIIAFSATEICNSSPPKHTRKTAGK